MWVWAPLGSKLINLFVVYLRSALQQHTLQHSNSTGLVMKIHQVDTKSELDNFTYVIELNDGSAVAIDPWDDAITNQLLLDNKLSLQAIINTHEHWDHIQGNTQLVAQARL